MVTCFPFDLDEWLMGISKKRGIETVYGRMGSHLWWCALSFSKHKKMENNNNFTAYDITSTYDPITFYVYKLQLQSYLISIQGQSWM